LLPSVSFLPFLLLSPASFLLSFISLTILPRQTPRGLLTAACARRRLLNMADQQLATAMANIAAALQALQQQQGVVRPPAAPVLQHYDAATPFDLSSRSGSSAYEKACSALPDKWDGSVEKLPNFIIALMTRASESKWDAPAPNGILAFTVGGASHNLFTGYHSIPLSDIEAAATTRTDDRAIQNARCLYHCVKQTLEGDIRETIFEQVANLPSTEDGATLFKTITSLSMASSLQLTIQTIQQIQALDPSDFDYKISGINTRLVHLFLLASSVNRQLSEQEKIQHTLTTYAKIKQPEAWAQWVRAKVDAFDENQLTASQALMNAATLKQTKIKSDSGDFRGRSTTIHEDVVAMLATKKRPPTGSAGATPKIPTDKKATGKLPPFVRHFKASTAAGGAKYVVGDTKTFDGVLYYFCGCPTHRDSIKWHTHAPDTCRVRQKWLAGEGSEGASAGNPTATANAALDKTPDDASQGTKETDLTSLTQSSGAPDVISLLANALSSIGDNPIAKDLIADALTAIHDA
jgi:hypothetical protein